ncbi:MAG: hypothetical protein J7527_06595, partial [Chitinophagaceae bacterium]|nr:hypothetical protein [Chitinophagaceae bacterium]
RRVRCVSPRPPRSYTPVRKSEIYEERLNLTAMDRRPDRGPQTTLLADDFPTLRLPATPKTLAGSDGFIR